MLIRGRTRSATFAGAATLVDPTPNLSAVAGSSQASFGVSAVWDETATPNPGSGGGNVRLPVCGLFRADQPTSISATQNFTLKIIYPTGSQTLQFTKNFSDIGHTTWDCEYTISFDLQEWFDVTESGFTVYEAIKDGSTVAWSLYFMRGTPYEEVLSGSAIMPALGGAYNPGGSVPGIFQLNGKIGGALKIPAMATGLIATGTNFDFTVGVSGTITYSDGNSLAMASGTSQSLVDHYNGSVAAWHNYNYDFTFSGGISAHCFTTSYTPPTTLVGGAPYYPLTVYATNAATAPAGYVLDGKLFAHDQGYPSAMNLDVGLSLASFATSGLTRTITAAPTFSDSYYNAGRQLFAQVVGQNTGTGATLPVLSYSDLLPSYYGGGITLNAASMAANQESSSLLTQVPLFWKKWDALTIAQASTVTADDGSTLTPSTGSWTGSTGLTLAIASGAVQATIPSSASSPRLTRSWSSLANCFNAGCYRYAKIRFRISGADHRPVDITFGSRTTGLSSAGRYKRWHETADLSGVWVERKIDLCSPDEWGNIASDGTTLTGVALPNVDSQSSRYPVPTVDSAYWGINLLQWVRFEPTGGVDLVLEVDYIEVSRDGEFWLSVFKPQLGNIAESPVSYLRALTDGKLSLEAVFNPGSGTRTVAQIVSGINGTPDGTGSDSPGFSASAGTGLGDGFHDDTRTANWIGGGGAYYDGSAFVPCIDQHSVSGSLVLPAMSNFNQMSWYPGCGDVLGFGDGLFGGPIILKAARVLRSNGNGLIFDDATGAPESGMTVDAYDLALSADAGNGASGANGYYSTGLPFGRGHGLTQNTRLQPRSAGTPPSYSVAWADHWRHRASFRVAPPGGANPWNLEHENGTYHATFVNSTGIVYRRSDFAAPPWGIGEIQVTSTATDSDPRVVRDYRGRLHITFQRGGDTYETFSDDDGATWSTPVSVITGGSRPTIAVGTDGTVVVAALVTGTPNVIKGKSQATGETSLSSLFTFQDDGGSDLAVEDDSFHIQQGFEGPSRWLLHVLIAGESATSHWASADNCRTWLRIT